MKMATVREFRNELADMLTDKEPIVVTRHGKMTGVYIPWNKKNDLPLELKKEAFKVVSEKMAKLTKDIDEKEMIEDFEKWRKGSRSRR
jgi:PHD/YefM family antitoxin component YafN of YafNO toxin-antitoxin module